MYYNPSYMNPIAQQPMQQEFSQQPTQEPLEGIASLAPTQPSQPIPPQMTEGIETLDTSNPTGPALVQQMQGRMQQQDIKPPAFMAYFKDVMDTGGYPTKTIQDYYNQFGDNSLQPLPVTQDNIQGGIQQPNEIGNQIIKPGTGNDSFQPILIGDTGLPFDMSPITPYVQNENLDLTDRAGIMQEFAKYLQGGLGSKIHTTDMQTGYSFMGEDMAAGSGTGFSDFRKFLDTFGIGDKLEYNPMTFEGIGKLQQAESLTDPQYQQLSMAKYEPVTNQQGIQSLSTYQSQQNTGPGI